MTEPQCPAGPPKKPPPEGDAEPPPKPKRYWWRFVLAAFLIVAVSAAATATAVLLYLDSVASALAHNNRSSNKLERFLAEPVDGGAAEHPHPRLRQTRGRRIRGRPGPLGHDDAAAARPRQAARSR